VDDLDYKQLQQFDIGKPFYLWRLLPLAVNYTLSDPGLEPSVLTWLLTLTARSLLLYCFEWRSIRPPCGYLSFRTELRRRDSRDSIT
jgi:hypothetical protein